MLLFPRSNKLTATLESRRQRSVYWENRAYAKSVYQALSPPFKGPGYEASTIATVEQVVSVDMNTINKVWNLHVQCTFNLPMSFILNLFTPTNYYLL